MYRTFGLVSTLAFVLALAAGCDGGGAKSSAGGTTKFGQSGRKIVADGMTALPSGLRYREVQAGTGRSPTAEQIVEVHYRGCFEDGKDFDSSYQRGSTTSFPVNRVIKGWTEALQLMKEGAKWELCIPPAIAYGDMGMPPVIPPKTTLYFEVELIKVK